MIGIEIWRYDTDCWKCSTQIQVVYPRGLGGFGGGTWELAGEKLVDKEYCNVEKTFSRTQGLEVFGNVCTNCTAYQGNHFIHEHVFDTVAAFQSWDRAREEYEVVDVVEVSYPCVDCGEELTYKREQQVCDACLHQREIEASLGDSVDLEYCEVCEGILHPEHRANHHTSYNPEETMLVCDTCHAKIHHKQGFRDDLLPQMTRIEAEQQGLI
ncbi:hypothetical protein GJR96_08465 [Haloferax sp. MBLA0076]|uniref:Uncharacterized protein n=1 Tax=Haloferax litoreum TaxID=2666140 RepID=A0A6A8GFR3_9EURY|nr:MULTISPECIES: hypothetical protein [Haloferax]KAB1193475.1 hypothetical protein Hfx1148_08455 [Haloferax sp. CBA1148]MRX21988.1 hypothetical protein [Haloferax litoreum]